MANWTVTNVAVLLKEYFKSLKKLRCLLYKKDVKIGTLNCTQHIYLVRFVIKVAVLLGMCCVMKKSKLFDI